jgi:hypothetical protein
MSGNRPARRSGYVATVGWRWLHREVDIRECTFPASELETLKAEIRAVSIQLFSTRSAVDGGEKLIRVYHGDGYIDIRQETIEQPQWRQLDDFLDRILKRFWPPPANPALREEARITPLAAQETRTADRGSQ